VRSLSSALILLPFFTSVLALAQPGGFRRAGIEENTVSKRAEPGARTGEINSKSLWGAFQDRAGEEISGQAWISRYPRDRGGSKHLHDRQKLCPTNRAPQSPGEL
jgi:hypothetical protein